MLVAVNRLVGTYRGGYVCNVLNKLFLCSFTPLGIRFLDLSKILEFEEHDD